MVGSVNALAKKAAISQTALRNYLLKSEPTRPVLEKLAAAAGVAPQWLILGLGPMCEADSPVAARAQAALEHVWRKSSSTRADTSETWDQFLARFRAGTAPEVPLWVSLALSRDTTASQSAARAMPGGAAANSLEFEPGNEPFRKLLSAFATEVARWKDRVASDPVALANVEKAAVDAFQQLVTLVRTDGRRPATSTIRTVLEANIFRLDARLSPDEDDSESESLVSRTE
jgi:hypothetical protein